MQNYLDSASAVTVSTFNNCGFQFNPALDCASKTDHYLWRNNFYDFI